MYFTATLQVMRLCLQRVWRAVLYADYHVVFLPRYLRDLSRYAKESRALGVTGFPLRTAPYLTDRRAQAGRSLKDLYVQQDLWAARLIFDRRPAMHYDIGSSIDGFIAHLLSCRQEVTLIDIRPYADADFGLRFMQADATNLSAFPDDSLESLSALCSLEHFGLGRYGDPIDPAACFSVFRAIRRVLKPGGHAYISLPVGPAQCIAFNGGRVFHPQTVVDAFPGMDLAEYACATPAGLVTDVSPDADAPYLKDRRGRPWDDAAYGLYHFTKR